jgi:hypothetical protein
MCRKEKNILKHRHLNIPILCVWNELKVNSHIKDKSKLKHRHLNYFNFMSMEGT